MRKVLFCAFLCLVAGLSAAEAWSGKSIVVERGAAETCATLPDGVRFPEGITANPHTDQIYVSTFDFGPNPNKLLRYSEHCHLLAVRDFGGTPLLGLAFNQKDHKVYIANFGLSKIQRIAANFHAGTPVEDVATIPGIGAPGNRTETNNPDGSTDTIIFGSNKFPAPNALTFNKAGDLFVSDSFQGAIWKISNADGCATPCPVDLVKQDPLLATAGFPPFGANGIAFNGDESQLFIANTGDDRILSLPMGGGSITVLAESINGADGVEFRHGRLWVAANQADEIVVLSTTGRVLAKLGDFLGIRGDGSPRGLLFPASLVIVDGWIYVTNLAIPLTGGDEPEADVTKWTISRIRIPDDLP